MFYIIYDLSAYKLFKIKKYRCLNIYYSNYRKYLHPIHFSIFFNQFDLKLNH